MCTIILVQNNIVEVKNYKTARLNLNSGAAYIIYNAHIDLFFIQSGAVIWRSHKTWNITLHTSLQEVRQTINQRLNQKDTPYLALTGEVWGVFREYFGWNWPRYNGTTQYIRWHVHVVAILQLDFLHTWTAYSLILRTWFHSDTLNERVYFSWCSIDIIKKTGLSCRGVISYGWIDFGHTKSSWRMFAFFMNFDFFNVRWSYINLCGSFFLDRLR